MALKAIDGLPILDAKQSLTLHIKSGDIARADRKEPADCAAARALRRQCHAKEVRIHLGRVYLRTNDGNWTRYMTPRSLRAELIAFDRGGSFEPGDFLLYAPQPSQALTGTRRGSRKVSPKKSTKKRAAYHVTTDVRGGPA